jgi:hypothetical protein
MESSSISSASSIEHTTKLNFGVNGYRIFSMMVIFSVLSLWIRFLLSIAIILEK